MIRYAVPRTAIAVSGGTATDSSFIGSSPQRRRSICCRLAVRDEGPRAVGQASSEHQRPVASAYEQQRGCIRPRDRCRRLSLLKAMRFGFVNYRFLQALTHDDGDHSGPPVSVPQ